MKTEDLKKKIRVNENIRAKEVRLVDAEGNQVGVVSVPEALRLAQEAELDLVEVAPEANPPVCRIINFGKFKYSLEKKEKEGKKKNKGSDIKEVKIGVKIGQHDYDTKLRNAVRFLSRGDKVKVTMWFRGREAAHAELGKEVIYRFVKDLEEHGTVERDTGLDGKNIMVMVAPKPAKSEK